jgi:hypothetical protein
MGRLAERIVELAERYGESSNEGVTITSPLSREHPGREHASTHDRGCCTDARQQSDMEWTRVSNR